MATNPYIEIPAEIVNNYPSLIDDYFRAAALQEQNRVKADAQPGFWDSFATSMAGGLASSIPTALNEFLYKPMQQDRAEQLLTQRGQQASDLLAQREAAQWQRQEGVARSQREAAAAKEAASQSQLSSILDAVLRAQMTPEALMGQVDYGSNFPVGGAEPPVFTNRPRDPVMDLTESLKPLGMPTEVSPELAPPSLESQTGQIGTRPRTPEEINRALVGSLSLAEYPLALEKSQTVPALQGLFNREAVDAKQAEYLDKQRERLTKQTTEARLEKLRQKEANGEDLTVAEQIDLGRMNKMNPPDRKPAEKTPTTSLGNAEWARAVTMAAGKPVEEVIADLHSTDPIRRNGALSVLASVKEEPKATGAAPSMPTSEAGMRMLLNVIATDPVAAAKLPAVQAAGGPAAMASAIRMTLGQMKEGKPGSGTGASGTGAGTAGTGVGKTDSAINAEAADLADMDLLKTIETTVQKNPEWLGGWFGLRGRTRSLQAKVNAAPEGFPQFASQVKQLTGVIGRAMAGAALTPTEKKIYLDWLPNVAENSDQEFMANFAATKSHISELWAYKRALRTAGWKPGMPRPFDPPRPRQREGGGSAIEIGGKQGVLE